MASAGSSNLGEEPMEMSINPKYRQDDFGSYVRDTISRKTENSSPFPHFQLENFLVDEDGQLTQKLRVELKAARFKRNDSDLNSISQTVDLAAFDIERFELLRRFHTFMRTVVRKFIEEVTGFELNENVALTGSQYEQTDHLLPHDDSLEGRKVAFVFYLSNEWEKEYGGELALYAADQETSRPTEVAKRLQPLANSFVFFPVETNTWHAVEEVLSSDYSRLSLNGWFHADGAKSAAAPKPEARIQRLRPTDNVTLVDVDAWVNANYIIPAEQKQVKRRFAMKSELFLSEFLSPEKYADVLSELKTARFEQIGPPDRRNVAKLIESSLLVDGPISMLLKLVRSDAFALLLTQWTGLKLFDLKSAAASSFSPPLKRKRFECNPQAGPSKAGDSPDGVPPDVELVSFIHRFEHGCYTMTDDQMAADGQNDGFCLDFLLFLGDFKEWPEDAGGFVSYIAADDPNELIRVPPRPNNAALLFREPEVLNFTKYVNCRAQSQSYYLVGCSFFGACNDENEESESSLDSNESSDEVQTDVEEGEGDDVETKT